MQGFEYVLSNGDPIRFCYLSCHIHSITQYINGGPLIIFILNDYVFSFIYPDLDRKFLTPLN
jgi:hypothetical protein